MTLANSFWQEGVWGGNELFLLPEITDVLMWVWGPLVSKQKETTFPSVHALVDFIAEKLFQDLSGAACHHICETQFPSAATTVIFLDGSCHYNASPLALYFPPAQIQHFIL